MEKDSPADFCWEDGKGELSIMVCPCKGASFLVRRCFACVWALKSSHDVMMCSNQSSHHEVRAHQGCPAGATMLTAATIRILIPTADDSSLQELDWWGKRLHLKYETPFDAHFSCLACLSRRLDIIVFLWHAAFSSSSAQGHDMLRSGTSFSLLTSLLVPCRCAFCLEHWRAGIVV